MLIRAPPNITVPRTRHNAEHGERAQVVILDYSNQVEGTARPQKQLYLISRAITERLPAKHV